MRGRIKDFNKKEKAPVLPEIGRLSVGIKDPSGGFPRSIDYFRPYGNNVFEAKFRKVYGAKPSELKIVFLESDASKVCNERLEIRVGSKRFAWTDGETFTWYDASSRKNLEKVVNSQEEQLQTLQSIEALAAKTGKSTGWKSRLTLRFFLPELETLGVVQFSTGGAASSIKQITGAFDTVLAAAKMVHLIPFKLKVKLHTADNMSGSKYPVITLEPMIQRDLVQQIGNYGNQLFKLLGGGQARNILELTEGEIQEALDKVTDRHKEPPEDVQLFTDVEYEDLPGEKEIGAPGAYTGDLEPGSLADDLRRLREASDNLAADQVHKESNHKTSQAFIVAYFIRKVELASSTKELDDLVRGGKALHTNNNFKNAVIKRREKLKELSQ